MTSDASLLRVIGRTSGSRLFSSTIVTKSSCPSTKVCSNLPFKSKCSVPTSLALVKDQSYRRRSLPFTNVSQSGALHLTCGSAPILTYRQIARIGIACLRRRFHVRTVSLIAFFVAVLSVACSEWSGTISVFNFFSLTSSEKNVFLRRFSFLS